MRRSSARPSRSFVVMVTCILAVPTVACIMQFISIHSQAELKLAVPYLIVGTALGIAHLILRPVLRLITAPLGCLTFGLSGTAIDVGLIYLSARVLPTFQVPSLLYALLTAILINGICAFAGAAGK